MPHKIIIADDDARIIKALQLLLKAEAYEVTTVTSPEECIQCVKHNDYSVALIDLNYQHDTTSGKEGLSLITALKAVDELLPIVIMTGYSSVDIAVEAMKLGASDFIQKPWENDRLLAVLHAQVRLHQSEVQSRKLVEQNTLLKNEISTSNSGIVYQSLAMHQLMIKLEKLAKSDMNILLTGENGTGKSMFADYLHQCSIRHNLPFIAVNMGAISEQLFESEMFGHVKGAFTDAKSHRIGRFELAEGGTIFLDEIGNIPLSQQAKLLRVLEERQFEKLGSSKTQQVNVRLVSATNSSLEQLIDDGQFRQDLLYRLNTVEVKIPALKERIDDILPLAEHFLQKYADKYRLSFDGFDNSAINAMKSYLWPGNIRELSHMIERALFLSSSPLLTADDLGLESADSTKKDLQYDYSNATLDDIERHIIVNRLKHFEHKAFETAQSLGLSRSAYYRRLEKHNL